MMNMSPDQVGKMSWHDFQGLLWHWNELHSTDDDSVEPVDAETYKKRVDMLARAGKLRTT